VSATWKLGVAGAGLLAAVLAIVGSLAACSNGTGTCPAKETIQPGASCDNDDLQCAFDLATPDPSCDGTQTTIATSCTCKKGTWSCPDPVACSTDAGGGDETSTGDDGGSGGDANQDAGHD
jgi:hypothetical protein